MSREGRLEKRWASFGVYPTLEPDGMPPSTHGHLSRYQQAIARGESVPEPDPNNRIPMCVWLEAAESNPAADPVAIGNRTSTISPPPPPPPPPTNTNGQPSAAGDGAPNWARSVFDGEVAATRNAVTGTRNDTLNSAALRLYRVALAGLLDENTVTNALTEAARAASFNGREPLTDSEVEGTLRSARAGAQRQGPAADALEVLAKMNNYGGGFDVPPEWHAAADAAAAAQAGQGGGGAQEDGDNATGGPPLYAARILTRSALRALPDPEPLIDNVLDQGTVALLYGKWGTAKSFIALDWAASVATGRPWQGRATQQRRVLYVAGEGAFGFKGRIDAWETGWQRQIGDADFAILPFAVNLTKWAEVGNLAALISWGGYSFVILDTLARCMVGADENSAKDCGVAVDSMTKLLGCTPGGRGVIQGVHHAGKDAKTLRGSSAFEGAADTVYFASRDGAVITLDREKRKDGPEVDRHELRLDLIDGTGSAVVSVYRKPPGGGTTEGSAGLLAVFVKHFAQTGASRTDLRKVADMADSSFYRSLNDLLEHGDLANTGTEKRPFYMTAAKARDAG